MAESNPIELQKALKGVEYPADTEDLAECARNNGADSELVEKLRSLPGGSYDGPEAVSRAVFVS